MEGYIYNSYGKSGYLKHVLASVYSLRRYDQARPVALFCTPQHEEILREMNLLSWFEVVKPIDPDHCSIIGFKHNVDKYMAFDANLFLDSDIIWCKNPDALWQTLSTYTFTITGKLKSDIFFGTHKDIRVLSDVLLNRRKKTLEHFGLTYLSRVQSGMIYARDYEVAKSVCELAVSYMEDKIDTHFTQRFLPDGSTEESDEWGFAMAMSHLNLPVIPWFQGEYSPQLDFVSSYVKYDPEFLKVMYLYYTNQAMNDLRGVRSQRVVDMLKFLFKINPAMGDHVWVTPYSLHFGWKHEKKPFDNFAEMVWGELTAQAIPAKKINKKNLG